MKTLNKPVWIHIGFPKCGSTSLQQDFFSQCPAISYAGRFSPNTPHDPTTGWYLAPTTRLAGLLTSSYLQEKERIKEDLIRSFINKDGSIYLISDEGFTTQGFLGGKHPHLCDTEVVADRLFDFSPEANILMVIRNQKQFLPSAVAQLRHNNEQVFDENHFYKHQQVLCEAGLSGLFHMADYNRVYDVYEKVFGAGRVHVFLLEDIAADPLGTTAKMIDLFGLTGEVDPEDYLPNKRNKRHTQTRLQALARRHSRLNKMCQSVWSHVPVAARKRLLSVVDKSVPGIEMTSEREEFLTKFYGPGNRALQKKIFGDTPRLEELGYPLS